MKKRAWISLLAVVFVFGLAGCSGEGATSADSTKSSSSSIVQEEQAPEDPKDAIKIKEKTIFEEESTWTGLKRVFWIMENTSNKTIHLRSDTYAFDYIIPAHKTAMIIESLDDETADAPDDYDFSYVGESFQGQLEVIEITSTSLKDNIATITYKNNDDEEIPYLIFDAIFYRDGKPVEYEDGMPDSSNPVKPGEKGTLEIKANVDVDDVKAFVAPISK